MAFSRADLAAAVRPFGPGGKLLVAHIPAFTALADALGLPPDQDAAQPVTGDDRLTVKAFQRFLGVKDDGDFGGESKRAMFAKFSNRNAAALTPADFAAAAGRLQVPAFYMRAVRAVEAPRGPYDEAGRPSTLYERHVANRNTVPPGRFESLRPDLFNDAGYGPGGYGAYSAQYDKLAAACALDPHAALEGCSWGAFQVLGENAVALGYASPLAMVLELVTGEAAHLETFVRYVLANKIDDELRQCVPGDPESCIPFVSRYNGSGFRKFDYHRKFAAALLAERAKG